MRVIGLTGGIASGKSTVSKYLRELGAAIIDADLIAKETVEGNTPALQEIAACFGEGVLTSEGQLDRKKLAELIFDSPDERQKLNRIIHPRVISRVKELIALYKKQGNVPLIVVDAPLLLECGMQDMVDEVWLVAVPEDVQVERLTKRENLSAEAAQKRIDSQMKLEDKIKQAHRIIDNSQELAGTLAQVDEYWAEVAELHESRE